MRFVTDPPISTKIRKMKQRVRWRSPQIMQRGIDQTRMVFSEDWENEPDFSFLVIGDSGSSAHRKHNPQRQIAEQMTAHLADCRFTIHTGDVVYLVGSREYYHDNFIKPYRKFLVGGEKPRQIEYNKMVFQSPMLPVPGNHDYYDLPLMYGLMTGVTQSFRRQLQLKTDFDMGWFGSDQGDTYAAAFLDYLKALNPKAMEAHLDRHYTAKTETGLCLLYQPGQFTRLPNRYYTFRCGGIDFFALDSNTFNDPPPLPDTREGRAYRLLLENRRTELEQQKQDILKTCETLDPNVPEQAERLDDLRTKLEQIDEVKLDIEKQLTADKLSVTDYEQLEWLRERLITSWQDSSVRGRVVYFHHPPYVTEATKWQQAQTLAIRNNLRWVLDAVAAEVGDFTQGRPLIDLVLNGHAHCLEYLRTGETGHADSHMDWIVCGGSGYSLRRQREEGAGLSESDLEGKSRSVARSHLFIGRTGRGSKKRRPYSFLRIDVSGDPPKFTVRPFICEYSEQEWQNSEVEPFVIGGGRS
ncbi:metallophosphoesterase [Oculatella sp. FACHB-28]|uniref:metallophosphoesterase n=1 Tax=Oculatella sp. FACHB-28 TaxID=2692845 RepID=UPI0016853DD8|nr:metallophosphoesterase [Oculatella sp. FACHB-28]MBD2058778.1 metallophosphoesterase [Oculatella sp. FACHB-28]